jgi:hypothetical protein
MESFFIIKIPLSRYWFERVSGENDLWDWPDEAPPYVQPINFEQEPDVKD